jgi:hypothetical protein
VALVVRKGNPKGVRTWEDLLKPGVQIIVANPKTAGVARWIFLALWGSKMKKGDAAAIEYITKVCACWLCWGCDRCSGVRHPFCVEYGAAAFAFKKAT